MCPLGVRQPLQAEDTAVAKGLFKHREHVNLIHDHVQLVPHGKSQKVLQLFRGVDVTQRVLGVDEDKAFDLDTLRTDSLQDHLQLLYGELEGACIQSSYLAV